MYHLKYRDISGSQLLKKIKIFLNFFREVSFEISGYIGKLLFEKL
jgi:hypothetical protein